MTPATLAEQPSTASARETSDLVDRLIAHEEGAFDELVRIYRPRLLAVASHVLHSAADAEDALQESFVSVVRSISGFKRESSIGTWMHRVVVNCALMRLRQRRRRHEGENGSQAWDGANRAHGGREPDPSAQDVLANEDLRRAVRREVARLPESQRTVLQMHDVDGFELKEVAELLDVGLSTVKSRLHRAHVALQEALG